MKTTISRWVRQSFGSALLGDARRTKRLLLLISAALIRPMGRITAVFDEASERQAAYDFVEHETVSADAVIESVCVGFVGNCSKEKEVLVAIDGTSITVTDREHTKGIGSIGSRNMGVRGEKVVTTLAMTTSGVPIGPPALVYWERPDVIPLKPVPAHERESRYWRDAVGDTMDRFRRYAPKTRVHFLGDREGDASSLMYKIVDEGAAFTIRSNGTRHVMVNEETICVRSALERLPLLGKAHVRIGRSTTRKSRTAKLSVRATAVQLNLKDATSKSTKLVTLHAVLVREVGTTPRKEKPLDWLLFTTTPVESLADAIEATQRYAKRWRIEDFHRTWKDGQCRVEETQLRSPAAIKKWATILAVVAARSEHLRHVSRESPDLPASAEFSPVEIQAVILRKTRVKTRTEVISDDPTLKQIVRWIADLGGYVGGKSAGPPGATVISRGLLRVLDTVEVLDELQTQGKLR